MVAILLDRGAPQHPDALPLPLRPGWEFHPTRSGRRGTPKLTTPRGRPGPPSHAILPQGLARWPCGQGVLRSRVPDKEAAGGEGWD